jgi:PAS domain S-box-containing protein
MRFSQADNYLKSELYNTILEDAEIFEFIQEGSLDGIWYWDLQKIDNIWMSPKFWEVLGYDPAEKKHLSSEWQDIIFQDDLKLALENFKRHCEDPNHPYDQIVRYKHGSGSTVWIRCRGLAIRNEQGSAIRMLGAHTDITEIKLKEEQVDAVKQRLEIIFHGTHDSMALISVQEDGSFKYELVNSAYLKQFSLPKNKVEGLSPIDVFGKELGTIISSTYTKCIDTADTIEFEEQINIGETCFNFQTTLTPIGEKDVDFIVESKNDITELKKTLNALVQEKDNLDAIFESSPVAMLAVDETVTIVAANKAALELCGGDSSNVMHHRPGDALKCSHSYDNLKGCGFGEDCPICPVRRGIEDLISSSGGRIHRTEVELELIKDKTQHHVWLEIGAETMMFNGERRVCIALEDISERKRLEEDVKRYHESLEKSNKLLEQRFEQSISLISKIGEMRDIYTAGHQKRVKELSCAIASEIGLTQEQITNISYGAQIHDIGKAFIASEMLNKPGKISDLEFKIIQTHVEIGYNTVKDVDFPWEVSTMIYQHHERLDGLGYPQGLSGEQIILESRILAVSDVVEAMTSSRPYRPALGIDVALEEIAKYRGAKYDEVVVDTCIKLFKEKGFQFTSE